MKAIVLACIGVVAYALLSLVEALFADEYTGVG